MPPADSESMVVTSARTFSVAGKLTTPAALVAVIVKTKSPDAVGVPVSVTVPLPLCDAARPAGKPVTVTLVTFGVLLTTSAPLYCCPRIA